MGEQPLPPHGACLLGSFNTTKYVTSDKTFDEFLFRRDIQAAVRAVDNVLESSIYPLEEQRQAALDKRRMGLGVTGMANTIEYLWGCRYGTPEYIERQEYILGILRDTAYSTSVSLSIEKGPFPLYDHAMLDSDFCKTLPYGIQDSIRKYGIRNSHLLSIAPTGTISLCADNVSSGIEPVFSHSFNRKMVMPDGVREETVEDYAVFKWGHKCVTANEVTVERHVDVLTSASYFVDSACSKTCNVGDHVSWEDFKSVYMRAYDGGASGCTTYRAAGKRAGILTASTEETVVEEPPVEDPNWVDEGGQACYYDPTTGTRSCDE